MSIAFALGIGLIVVDVIGVIVGIFLLWHLAKILMIVIGGAIVVVGLYLLFARFF